MELLRAIELFRRSPMQRERSPQMIAARRFRLVRLMRTTAPLSRACEELPDLVHVARACHFGRTGRIVRGGQRVQRVAPRAPPVAMVPNTITRSRASKRSSGADEDVHRGESVGESGRDGDSEDMEDDGDLGRAATDQHLPIWDKRPQVPHASVLEREADSRDRTDRISETSPSGRSRVHRGAARKAPSAPVDVRLA